MSAERRHLRTDLLEETLGECTNGFLLSDFVPRVDIVARMNCLEGIGLLVVRLAKTNPA